MAIPLLTTKLHIPPIRSELVLRPQLIERLDAGLGRKLILICAPPGFGKTTLLSAWAHAGDPGPRFAWLSLDESDNDPIRFWRYVIAAVQTVDPGAGQAALAALESFVSPSLDPLHVPAIEPLVTAWINHIATSKLARAERPCVLVLEDYHVIDAEPIHRSVNLLLDYMPAPLRLAIATRADPPLFLARRRARMELTEIRAEDLRFTAQEAAEFVNRCMGLDLSAHDVAALEERTEGWIAGLQMAALSLQDEPDRHRQVTAFAGDDRYVADYLAEEVLQRQPQHVRSFLLRTSILERLCGPLCDALLETGDQSDKAGDSPSGHEMLEFLERANLFVVPLDRRRYWYRYHNLFADLLRQRLHGPGGLDRAEIAVLHARASDWHEREGFIAEAVAHRLAVPDYERAADLVAQHALELVFRGETVLARRWLDALPEDRLRSRAALCTARAWATFLSPIPDVDLAERWLQDAERAPDGEESLAGDPAVLRAFIAFQRGGDPRAAIERARLVLARLPEGREWAHSALVLLMGEAHLSLGDLDAADGALDEARLAGVACDSPFAIFSATYLQANLARERGELSKVEALCHDIRHAVIEPSEHRKQALPGAEALDILLGSARLERNELREAELALNRGWERVQAGLGTHPLYEIEGTIWMARLRQAQGDVTQALAQIDRAARGPLAPAFAPCLAAHRVRLWLAQAERDPSCLYRAERWALEEGIALEAEPEIPTVVPFFRQSWLRLSLARLLIARHRAATSASERPDLQPLLRFLDDQLSRVSQAGWLRQEIELRVLQALTLQALGDTFPALSALERALVLAEPEGFVRVFADEGTAMARLLYRAVEQGAASRYANHVLASWEAALPSGLEGTSAPLAASTLAGTAGPEAGGWIEPLSEREQEVLALIASGLSNQEIARQLTIATSTVKVHTSNIYGKLGVRSRTQAVARARVLGILPEH